MWDSHPHLATHADIRTSVRSSRPHGRPSQLNGTLPYHPTIGEPDRLIRSFGTKLEPREFSAQIHLTSELLRTLSMMAASEPTSWLSSANPHPLPLSLDLGTLAGGPDCFPFDHEA